ncbi:MAG: hypothetical protein IJ899_00940, partial [Blautia sp.]|nr:hypothetical protein [Blautia sp.]
ADIQINYRKTFTEIPSGTYTVKEINTAIIGFTLETGDGAATVIEGTATVETGKTAEAEDVATIELVDEYTENEATLVIEKTFAGDLTDAEIAGDLTFKVVDETTGETVGEYTIGRDFEPVTREDGSEKYILTLNVTPDHKISVEEVLKDVTGYTASVRYTVADTETGDSVTEDKAETTVERGGVKVVEVEDTFTKNVGDLLVTTAVRGGVTREQADRALSFQITTVIDEPVRNEEGNLVYDEDGSIRTQPVTYYLTADGTLTTEETTLTPADGFETEIVYDGHPLTYDEDTGTWYYTDENGERQPVEDEDVQIHYRRLFTDIPAGEYTITETKTDIEGYILETGEGSDTVITGTATVENGRTAQTDDAAQIDLIAVYVKAVGDLVITKTVKGGVTKEEADGALTFQVTTVVEKEVTDEEGNVVCNEDGTVKTEEVTFYLTADGELTEEETTLQIADGFEGVEEYDGHALTYEETSDTWYYTDDAGEKQTVDAADIQINYRKTFTEIPSGTYTVKEINTAIIGFTLETGEGAATVIEGTATVEIGKTAGAEDVATVELVDEYTENEATLVIEKTFAGDLTDAEIAGDLTFKVVDETTGETVGEYTIGRDFEPVTREDGSEKYILTLNVTPDHKISVEEVLKDVTGYTASVRYTVADTETGDSVTEDKAETTVERGGVKVVEVEDTFTKNVGDLLVTTAVRGGVTREQADRALSFQITTVIDEPVRDEEGNLVYDEDGSIRTQPVTYYLTADGTLTTEETTLTPADGFETEIVYDGHPLTYDEEAGTWYYTDENGERQPVNDEDVQIHYRRLFANIPAGEYTITETRTAIEGFTLQTGNGSGTVITGRATVENGRTAATDDAAQIDLVDVYIRNEIHFTINKVEAGNGAEIDGAVMTVYETDADGNIAENSEGEEKVIDSWTSKTGETHDFGPKLKAGKTYILREVVVPDGYAAVTDIRITVAGDGTITSDIQPNADGIYLVEDQKCYLTVEKVLEFGLTREEVYSGDNMVFAKDRVYHIALYHDEALTSLVDGSVKPLYFDHAHSASITYDNLEWGKTYYVAEVAVNDDGTGVIPLTVKNTTEFLPEFRLSGTADALPAFTPTPVTMTQPGNLRIELANIYILWPSGFYFEGNLKVTKKLFDADGEELYGDGCFYAGIFEDENLTTLAFDLTDTPIVTFDMDGSSSVTEEITIFLTPDTSMEVIDPDAAKATLYVTETDEYGNPIIGAPVFKYDVTLTSAGEQDLVEIKENYAEATVTRNHVSEIVIENKVQENPGEDFTIYLAKAAFAEEDDLTEDEEYSEDEEDYSEDDENDSEEEDPEEAEVDMIYLSGAQLALYLADENGNAAGAPIAVWTSSDQEYEEYYEINGLMAQTPYIIRETAAPTGYQLLEEDILFTIDEDGNIETESEMLYANEDMGEIINDRSEAEPTITPTPTPTPGTADLRVTKELILMGEDDEDGFTLFARNKAFYVALFKDPELTELIDGSIQKLTYKNSAVSTVTYKNLTAGKTYYVAEVDKNGKVLEMSEDGGIPIYQTGVDCEIVRLKKNTSVSFMNVFTNLADGYFVNAELEITKTLLDKNGKAKASDETFLAGIFTDEKYSELATTDIVDRPIVTLKMNGKSSVTELVNVHVMTQEEALELYVAEVLDKKGTLAEQSAAFPYKIQVECNGTKLKDKIANVGISYDTAASVKITNRETGSSANTPTPTPTPAPIPITVTVTPVPTATPYLLPGDGGRTVVTYVTPGVRNTNGNTTATTNSTRNSTVKTEENIVRSGPAATGDDTPITLYILLLCIAAFALTGAAAAKKRRN